MKKLIYLIVLLFTACTNQNSQRADFPELTGEYLGQETPKDSAILFAPDIVSSGMADRDIAIYPDGSEIYFCRNIVNFKFSTIFYSKKIDGKWIKPKIVSFGRNRDYIYIEPHISPDGKKLYFASNMPINGKDDKEMNIWVSDRVGDGWGEPYSIGDNINTTTDQYFPSVTKDGTIYYTSEDSTNEEFIFRSRLVNGEYQKPEKLPDNVNMGRARFNAFISPNEDFIIVPAFGMPDTYGATDYYIVFRDKNDRWSAPLNMGENINSKYRQEWSASISPDGKYIFFMSDNIPLNFQGVIEVSAESYSKLHNKPQNGNSDIYWVKAEFIEELRKQAVFYL